MNFFLILVPARISLGVLTVLTLTTQCVGVWMSLPRVSYIKVWNVHLLRRFTLLILLKEYIQYTVQWGVNWWCLRLTFVLNQTSPEKDVGDRDEVPEQMRKLRFILEPTPDTSTTTGPNIFDFLIWWSLPMTLNLVTLSLALTVIFPDSFVSLTSGLDLWPFLCNLGLGPWLLTLILANLTSGLFFFV